MAISITGIKHRDQFSVEPGPPPNTYDYTTYTYGTLGTYQPGATTVGLPAGLTQADLTPVTAGTSGDITITAGGVYDKIRYYGRVVIKTSANVIFTRCWFGGRQTAWPQGDTGVIDCENNPGSSYNCKVYDSVLAADRPSVWANGIIGHDFEIHRCDVHSVTDGVDAGNVINAAGQANVKVRGCWIHDLSYFSPDPLTATTERFSTHNDGIQWFAGANLEVVGNFLDGRMNRALGAAQLDQAHRNVVTGGGYDNPFADPTKDTLSAGYNSNYPNIQVNSAIQVTTKSSMSGLRVDSNWIGGGGYGINIGGSVALSNTGTVTNNRFIRTFLWGPVCNPSPGSSASTGVSLSNNVYDDTGTPITVFVGP